MNFKKAACTCTICLSLAALDGQVTTALGIGHHPEHRAQAAPGVAAWQLMPPAGATVAAPNFVRRPFIPVTEEFVFFVDINT